MEQLELKKISELTYETNKSIKEEVVKDLAESIAKVGLLHPIVVNTKNRVISGRHRILAYQKLEIDEIPARIIRFSSADERCLATIDENLSRGVYTEYERCLMYLEHKTLMENLGLVSKSGGDKSKVRNSQLESAAKKISRKTNESQRTISEAIQIAKDIPRELDQKIIGTPLENHKQILLKIAKASGEKKKEVIEKALLQFETKKEHKSSKKNKLKKIELMSFVGNSQKKLSAYLREVRLFSEKPSQISKTKVPALIEDLAQLLNTLSEIEKVITNIRKKAADE